MVLGVLELEHGAEGGNIDVPATGFILGAFLRLQHEGGDVSEGAGAASGETVGSEGVKELAENVVDVDLGDVIAGGAVEFGGEVVLALLGGGLGAGGAGVHETEAVAVGIGGEAAEASIGELELAEIEDVGGSGVGHGESIANNYAYVNILIYTNRTHFIHYSNGCGKAGSGQPSAYEALPSMILGSSSVIP